VSTAYTVGSWTGFGSAVTTAAAALAGLLFIALSINLRQILEVPGLPSRAAQTLICFATPLVAALLLIVPGQGRIAVGSELLATGLFIGAVHTYLDRSAPRSGEHSLWRRTVGSLAPAITSCGCLIIGGATLLAGAGGGLYWLVPGVISAIVIGLANVWVLLVEILR